MGFRSKLSRFGWATRTAAPTLVSLFHPLAGAVLQQILQAESVYASGQGEAKKGFVLATVQQAFPLAGTISGDTAFAPALANFIEATVVLLNVLQLLPKRAKS